MKFIISILLIALLSYALCLVLPWWGIAIAAFIVSALIQQQPFASFATGFIALFLLWGIMSWFISNANHDILAHRISQLVLKVDNPLLLVFLTALTGAVVAGLASLAGSFAHRKLRSHRWT